MVIYLYPELPLSCEILSTTRCERSTLTAVEYAAATAEIPKDVLRTTFCNSAVCLHQTAVKKIVNAALGL